MKVAEKDDAPASLAAAEAAASALLGAPVRAVATVGQGGNNRAYRVEAGGERYALKAYFRSATDTRDRLAAEFDGLSFLATHGVSGVPVPVAADREAGFALYRWIEGGAVEAIGAAEIDAALAFSGALHALAANGDAGTLPPASEACLSGAEIERQIERRLQRLEALPRGDEGLAAFLADVFRPLFGRVTALSRDAHAQAGLAYADDLDARLRTLSPSDFGFHNALSTADGLAFLDFEYFGWDDPVKLTSDFLWHPRMNLDDAAKRRWTAGMVDALSDDAGFRDRLAARHPLFGLRWTMIVLNEFLADDLARRRFAGHEQPLQALRQTQLAKARRLAETVERTHEKFPYAD